VRLGIRHHITHKLPFGVRQTARVTRHAEYQQYLSGLVQIKIQEKLFFRQALSAFRSRIWISIDELGSLSCLLPSFVAFVVDLLPVVAVAVGFTTKGTKFTKDVVVL
jgi:hypothetical protein